MGSFVSLFSGGSRFDRTIMLGLDNSGKSTILYKLKYGQVVATNPTIGFNVELVDHKIYRMTIWDIGGGDKVKTNWIHYFYDVVAIIFVIDSGDKERIL